ncbi:MAG: nucleotidyltransferase domain-containing protein [Candidatus Falkowbacteria bacterium]|nr:nucleotidyltransferase domain-containing protein [Candidatus Falkowbacteria bacterium]
MNNLELEFNSIVSEAENDSNVLGMILVGSRGKGFENEHSDFDAIIILSDKASEEIMQQYKNKKSVDMDLNIFTLTDFKNYATWDSSMAWDRYTFAHVKILINKIENLEELIKDKGYIPSDKQKQFIEWWIDGYINGVFRSIKALRNKNEFGARLEATNSILDLLTLVFGINGRHRPFLGYTEKELLKYPLEKLPWEHNDFIKLISIVLETSDLKTQQKLLQDTENWCIELGYGHIIDAWEGKDKWAINLTL